jgi:alpha-beta hydrolase superfamily lysophospholipase
MYFITMLKKIFLILAVPVLLLITAGGYYALYHIAPYAIIVPYRPPIDDSVYAISPEKLGLPYEHFTVVVDDSIGLDTWFLPSRSDSVYGTILLLHGIGGVKEHMLGSAARLASQGFNILLYDSRAHGHSSGRYCTYGYYEKYDVSKVIDEASRRFGTLGPFAVCGSSFGGAVALQAMTVEPRIVCGVVESTFAALDDIVFEYQQRMLHIPFRFVAHEALERACDLAHFDAGAVQPEQSAAAVQCPVLVFHGDADERIDIRNGRRIFDALASPRKQWLVIHGAGHENLARFGGLQYDTTRSNFFRYWLQHAEHPGTEPTGADARTSTDSSVSYHFTRYSR